jgi:hypothetical protein
MNRRDEVRQRFGSRAVLLSAFGVSVAGIACLAVAGIPGSSRQELSKKSAQSPQTSTQLNTCKCEPPIRSQATATGTCTRTQDDGTFCDLKFSLAANAKAAISSSDFGSFAADANIPTNDFEWFVRRLDDRYELRKTDEAEGSVKAAATLAAFGHQQDVATQRHMRDILSMLTLETAEPRKQLVWRSLEWFASNDGRSPHVEKIPVDNRVYEIITTPGCINFSQESFTFMVKTTGDAPSCDRPR